MCPLRSNGRGMPGKGEGRRDVKVLPGQSLNFHNEGGAVIPEMLIAFSRAEISSYI